MATVTLHHPARRNAMTRAMWRGLQACFSADSDSYVCRAGAGEGEQPVRCIVLRGAMGHFCAGGDISEYPAFRFQEASLRAFHEETVAPALEALLACDLPLVAQIEGHCMGGGLEIAACCDIRVAAEDASFGAPIARLGFPMAPREARVVLQAVGELTAREMLLEARVLGAAQMLARGFLSRVVPDAAREALQTARAICQLGPQAARLNKQTLRQLLMSNMPLAGEKYTQLAINNIANPYAYAESPEHVEGVQAFLEKRTPQFCP